MKVVPVSPFRLRRRIGPRPAFPGVDATAKVVGAAPFVEPEQKASLPFLPASSHNLRCRPMKPILVAAERSEAALSALGRATHG